uniref:Uncharacterized protein n=1 Tax=Anguilla anguilla TaxID=7936 RepID=A0A0E9T051_ANGAN
MNPCALSCASFCCEMQAG